jgi:hypothetical protein
MEMVAGDVMRSTLGRFAVALLALTAAVAFQGVPEGAEDRRERGQKVTISNFDLALGRSGQEYLNLELELRRSSQANEAERAALGQIAASHPDAVARLLARVVLDWAGPKQTDFKAALDYLDDVPIRLKKTALGFPSPTGTEGYLTFHFGDRVAELLALRLIKSAGWPRWKVNAIVFYLQAHKVRSTTSVLLRLSIESTDPEWRKFALEAVREIHDPDLPAKLAFEIARARKLGHAVAPEVRTLAD